jgi:hypothetical protein
MRTDRGDGRYAGGRYADGYIGCDAHRLRHAPPRLWQLRLQATVAATERLGH